MTQFFKTISRYTLLILMFLFVLSSVGSATSYEDMKTLRSHFRGKKIVVMGDSISTLYKETPSGYHVYYSKKKATQKKIKRDTTWWGAFIKNVGGVYAGNYGWCSSMVGYYGHKRNKDLSENAAMANYKRINALKKKGIPDVILIEAGLNDLDYGVRAKKAQIGTFRTDAAYVRKLDKKTKKFKTFVQAYVTMITRIRAQYPKAELIVLLPEYSQKKCSRKICDTACRELIRICNYYQIPYADMRPEVSGLKKGYKCFVDGTTHPNNYGFSLMTNTLQNALAAYYKRK